MRGEYVIDASVAAKLCFDEAGSDKADAAVRQAQRLIGPDLLFHEMASIAAKNVRRGTASMDQAASAVASTIELLDETIAAAELAPRAFELAATHGFSAYDGAYLALAELRSAEMLTADGRLVRRARGAGMGAFVCLLD